MLRIRAAVVVVVTIVWCVVIVAAVFNPDLVTLATVVTPVMLAAMGGLLTGGVIKFLKEPAGEHTPKTNGG